jgi:hypothetical protein
MRAMGIPYTAAHGTIRFSLSRYTTEAEIDRVIQVTPEIVAQLRKLSPYWGETGPADGTGKGVCTGVRLTPGVSRNRTTSNKTATPL